MIGLRISDEEVESNVYKVVAVVYKTDILSEKAKEDMYMVDFIPDKPEEKEGKGLYKVYNIEDGNVEWRYYDREELDEDIEPDNEIQESLSSEYEIREELDDIWETILREDGII